MAEVTRKPDIRYPLQIDEAAKLMYGMDSLGNINVANIDTNGIQTVKAVMDLIADFEITGEEITVTTYDNTCNGSDQAIVAVGAGDKMKLYKLTLQVASDLTGSVTIKLGSESVGKIVNPKAGGQYMIISALPDFKLGALGADLIMNGTSGAVATINAHYKIFTV